MQIPFWKRWLSYLYDVQVDYRASGINGDLIVFLVKGRYQLCTANAIYSFEDKYANFGNVFQSHVDLERLPGKRCLVLGLGLGSVPIILDKIYPGQWDFTGVDIDEEVCMLAAEYGYPKLQSQIDTVIGDAFSFVHTCQEQFDLICIDLFIDDVMPEQIGSRDFLEAVQDRLKAGGLIVTNTLAFTEEHKRKSKAYFAEKFQPVFADAQLIPTHLNYMLINDQAYLRT